MGQTSMTGLVDLLKIKGRYNVKDGRFNEPWRYKKIRSHDIGQAHLDYITENETYTEAENAVLCDLIDEKVLEMDVFRKLDTAFNQLSLETLRKFIGENEAEQVSEEEWNTLKTSPHSIVKAIALIFARCGAECGKVKRVLDENEISWGYFTDHNPFEPHCNAHPNNLIVIDPTRNKFANILAVLDFDLAFDSESFVNTVVPDPDQDAENFAIQEKKYGTNDKMQFDDWICSEKYELESALGGAEVF